MPTPYLKKLSKLVGAECVNAATRLLAFPPDQQQFEVGQKVKVIEPMIFGDKRSKANMPGTIVRVGSGQLKKEFHKDAVDLYQYEVETEFGHHVFDQVDLKSL